MALTAEQQAKMDELKAFVQQTKDQIFGLPSFTSGGNGMFFDQVFNTLDEKIKAVEEAE
jgi:hypothetical protein